MKAPELTHVETVQIVKANGAMSMSQLEEDLPHFITEIRQAVSQDKALQEALADYETACRMEADCEVSGSARKEWSRIRGEVVAEMSRLIQRHVKQGPTQ